MSKAELVMGAMPKCEYYTEYFPSEGVDHAVTHDYTPQTEPCVMLLVDGKRIDAMTADDWLARMPQIYKWCGKCVRANACRVWFSIITGLGWLGTELGSGHKGQEMLSVEAHPSEFKLRVGRALAADCERYEEAK